VWFCQTEVGANQVAKSIVQVTLADLFAHDPELILEAFPPALNNEVEDKDLWIQQANVMLTPEQCAWPMSSFVVVLTVDLRKTRLSPNSIITTLENALVGRHIVQCSPASNEDHLLMIRWRPPLDWKAGLKKAIKQKNSPFSMPMEVLDEVKGREIIDLGRKEARRDDCHRFEYETLSHLVSWFPRRVVVSGVRGITTALAITQPFPKRQPHGGLQATEEWIVQAVGTGLRELLAIPGIDHTRVTTNNIVEANRVWGIEVANWTIRRELQVALTGTVSVLDCHFQALADTMTYRGYLLKINRYGMVSHNC